MLQHRRDLKFLLDTLRTKGIQYKWKFPFCLSATTQGRTALLKVPEDLQHFCETLGIPLVDVPNWYADFRHTTLRKDKQQEEPMDAQDTRFRRRRSPSGPRHHTASHGPPARFLPHQLTKIQDLPSDLANLPLGIPP